jgi:PPP family 3-phenylpropionic acid transporter
VQTDKLTRPQLVTPTRLGSLYYLFTFLSAGAYRPFLFVYFLDLGLSGEQIGWLGSLMPLSMVLIAGPISNLADRKGWRVRIVQIALVGSGLSLFFLQFPKTFIELVLLILPLAAFSSPVSSIADSLIARMAQRDHLNYGGMRLWGSFGFAASALAFGAILQRLGFKPMFLIGSMLFLPLIWIAGNFEEGSIKVQQERKPISVLFRDIGLAMFLLATFLSAISNGLSMTFEGVYVRYLGGGNFLVGMMIAFAAFSELPAMYYSQRIAQRLRSTNTILLAYGFTAAAYLGFFLIKDPRLLPIFSILKGIGYGLNFTISVHILTERTPAEWASTAQSFLAIGWMGLAPLIASPLGGLIYDAISPAAVFGLGLITVGLGALVLRLAVYFGKLD